MLTMTQRQLNHSILVLQLFSEEFFCKGCLLPTALGYMQNGNDDYRDLKDGTKFCHLKKNMPFIVFFDELETGNQSESQRTLKKVGAVYLS